MKLGACENVITIEKKHLRVFKMLGTIGKENWQFMFIYLEGNILGLNSFLVKNLNFNKNYSL